MIDSLKQVENQGLEGKGQIKYQENLGPSLFQIAQLTQSSSTTKYYSDWIYYVSLDYSRAVCIISGCSLSFVILHFLTASSAKTKKFAGNNDKF